MLKYVVVASALLLSACASKPSYKLEDVKDEPKLVSPTVPGAEKIEKMDRREVINAVNQCEDAGMRPYVEYVTQKTDFGKVMVPINVHCDPKRQK